MAGGAVPSFVERTRTESRSSCSSSAAAHVSTTSRSSREAMRHIARARISAARAGLFGPATQSAMVVLGVLTTAATGPVARKLDRRMQVASAKRAASDDYDAARVDVHLGLADDETKEGNCIESGALR